MQFILWFSICEGLLKSNASYFIFLAVSIVACQAGATLTLWAGLARGDKIFSFVYSSP